MSNKHFLVLVGSFRIDYPRDEAWLRWFRSSDFNIVDLARPVDYKSRWSKGGMIPWVQNLLHRYFSWIPTLREIWRWSRNPDVIGIFVFRSNYVLLPVLSLLKMLARQKPVIAFDTWISLPLKAETTGQHPWVVKAICWLERWLLSRADLLVAVSDGYRTYYEERGLRNVRVVPLTAGEKWETFPRSNHVAERSFIYWGTFLEQHGVDILIEAVERMSSDRFRVALCGEGKSREANQRRTNGAASRKIEFLGYRRDEELIPMVDSCSACFGHLRAIHDFDLVLPNKAIQALARGKLVIMVRAERLEIGKDGRSPVVFFDGSSEDLARKMDEVLLPAARAGNEEQIAREFYKKHHSWPVVKAAADEFFDRLLLERESD